MVMARAKELLLKLRVPDTRKKALFVNGLENHVSSLYGWLLARAQTGNYCFWIDSDVHVRSRCIAKATFYDVLCNSEVYST
jgi:hypothetical protein